MKIKQILTLAAVVLMATGILMTGCATQQTGMSKSTGMPTEP